MSARALCLGYPRIGAQRELKRALEAFWRGKQTAVDLQAVASKLRRRHWQKMRDKGIASIPSNDFALYDHMLDMAVTLGAVPARYRTVEDPLARYFAMARGLQDADTGVDLAALEMTKWFDTNYHYIVPELAADQPFALDATKIFAELEEARDAGVQPRPVLIGPVTFLKLSKHAAGAPDDASTLEHLDRLIPVYEALLTELGRRDVGWVQVDEPCLVLDLDDATRAAYARALERLASTDRRPKLLLATYFGALGDNLPLAARSGFDALHVDLVRAPEQLDPVLDAVPDAMQLSLGVVDGRNIWRTDLDRAHALCRRAIDRVGLDRVLVAPSCSLLHVPVDLDAEDKLDPELRGWLAFAAQKLDELRALADAAGSASIDDLSATTRARFDESRRALAGRRGSARTRDPDVRRRVEAVDDAMLRRSAPFAARAQKQRARFGLPLLPTTTIGSFPQTRELRKARAAWRAGDTLDETYEAFLRGETRRCIAKQEALGLDVLVHGEFERTDMVEYFGEQLDGFAFTRNGWVQSYGSRCVKPPVLFGDVSRRAPMTVAWSTFAQSATERPMKGMLTGPVTILQWSFVRDDQPRGETCLQIALSLRDEVRDLEAAGIAMIQVDEPAIREGLPLRRGGWPDYLRWAVDAFRIATSGVRDETQIHTHMCYSEFGDMLDSIAELDADVLSIETSRSKMELLSDFARYGYPNEVGPGVYDIHSPRVATTEEMLDLLERAAKVLPVRQLWVNPDCGLKTRGWPEVEATLRNMVEAARIARTRL